jgi:murein DD-endopeptidase MepM/ murein hydrolase activator NlpD
MQRISAASAPVRRLPRGVLIGGGAGIAMLALLALAPSPAARGAAAPSPQSLASDVPSPDAVTYTGEAASPVAGHAVAEPGHVRATGRIGPDLSASLLAARVPERIGREYVAVLARAIKLDNGLTVEDKFDLVYEPGAEGRLLYTGLDRVGRSDLELVKWTDGKSVIWVNADGGVQSNPGMRMPVAGRVTSAFGERFHPILGYERFHKGVDLHATMGAPIVAAADGRVASAGWRGGYGRAVTIVHSGGIETLYGHMSRIAATPGEQVRQGQVIGYVGSSGLSTGPHLHYEVLKNGRAVNPLSVKMAGPTPVDGAKMHALRDRLRTLLIGSAS